MSKDQEDLFVYLSALCFGMPKEEVDKIIEFRDRIYKKIERLEAIENAKPSNVMECLKRVWNDINNQNDFRQDFKDLTIVENYILKAQEQEKVLKVIFEKNVDVDFLKHVFKFNQKLEEYNNFVEEYQKLSQEEFDLFQEVGK